MSMELEDVYDELAQNDRLQLTMENGTIFVESDEFGIVPASDSKPEQVQVTYTIEGYFDVHPVDTFGSMRGVSGRQAILCAEGFLKGNDLQA